MKIETWPLSKIIPYEKNARKIPQSAVDSVAKSLREFGWQQPIVVEPSGVIVVGHVRRLGALQNGDKTAPVHVARGLTPAQIKAYRLMDNRSHEEATWEPELLKAEMLELRTLDLDLGLTGFSSRELDALLRPALEGEDDAPHVPEVAFTQPGDLWTMGEHRLLCGDATDAATVARACVEIPEIALTDPPYNVDFDYGDKFDDAKPQADYVAWNRSWFGLVRPLVKSCLVLTVGITNLPMWLADIERTHRIITWVKENQCSRNYIGKTSGFNIWEPILVYGKAKTCVSRDSFNSPIHIQPDTGSHPCPKSIKAWSWLVEAFTVRNDLLFDPFMGSGTTLIAAHQLGRRSTGLELDPKYCDVAVQRWQNLTGKVAYNQDGVCFPDVKN